MICERCSTELPENAVACYRCGTMTDQITFVRPTPGKTFDEKYLPKVESAFDRGIKLVAVSALVLLGIAGVIFAMAMLNQQQKLQPPTQRASEQIPAAEPYKPPPATATFTPTPLPPPVQQVPVEPLVQPQQQAPQEMPYNPPPPRHATLSDYPEYDKRKRQLRAVCNSGTASYWQEVSAFTCMVEGGVYEWNPRWISPDEQRRRQRQQQQQNYGGEYFIPANRPSNSQAWPSNIMKK